MKISPEKIEKRLSGLLLAPECRKYRHIILLVVMMIISIDIVINHPSAMGSLYSIMAGIIGYDILIMSALYINIYILIPRFLFKNKPFYYFLSVALIILVFVGLIVLLQLTFFDTTESLSKANPFIITVNLLSSMVILGLMIAGVTSFILLKHWNLTAQRIDQLQATNLQSELAVLKSQINPHFLFNVLNNANVLLKEKQGGASSILFKLEDLLRYQINESAREEISLVSDIDFLTDYLNLEKVRRDRFDFTINTCGGLDALMLPPLLFIPFVENAVKYSQDSENASYVHLVFTANDDEFFFRCENSTPPDGIGPYKSGGLGLKNISRRLELLFPDRHTLNLEQQTGKYNVSLYLKLNTQP